MIEDILVKTRYQASRGFTHMREASWYWPVFDVVKDDMIISIKTTQVTTGFGSLYANIRDLRWLVMSNKTLNGSTVIQQARLDVYVPADYNKSMLNQVQNFGLSMGVDVKILTF